MTGSAEEQGSPGWVFFDGSDDDVRRHLENVFGTNAFRLDGDEIVLELPKVGVDKHPRPSGETVHVRVRAPAAWTVQSPERGPWWHVVPEGSDATLCTIALSSWTRPAREDAEHPVTCPWCRARLAAIEIAAPPATGYNERAARPKLHEEIVRILRETGKPMTTAELADAVNRAGRYPRRDGSPVTPFQIHGRTRKYARLFARDGSLVWLIANDGSS